MNETPLRPGDKICAYVCHGDPEKSCRYVLEAQRESNIEPEKFPGGLVQIIRICKQYFTFASNPQFCRSHNAASLINGLIKSLQAKLNK